MSKRNRLNEEVNEFIKQLESETVNPDYRKFLLSNLRRANSSKPQKNENVKRICVKNDDTDEVSDSQYGLFFECLDKYEKSYVLEGKINGAPVCVIYERERRFGGKLEPKRARKTRKDIGRVDGAAADQSPRLPHKQPPVKQLASDNRRNEILKKKPDLRNKGIIKESEVGLFSKPLSKRMDNLRSCKVSKNMTFVKKESIVTKQYQSEPHGQAQLRRADKGKDVAKARNVPDSESVIYISCDGNQYQSPGPRNHLKSENQSEPVCQAQTIERKEVLKGENVVLSKHNLDTKKHVYLKPDPIHNSMTKNQVGRANQVIPTEEDKEVQRKTNLAKVMEGKNVVTCQCVANGKAVRYRDNEPLYHPKPSLNKNLEEHHHKDVDQTQPGKKYEPQSQRKLRKVVHGNYEIKVDDAASRNDAAQIENKRLPHKPCLRENQVTKNFIDQAGPKQSGRMSMKEIVIRDDSDSDVEILDSASFYRAGNQRSIATSKKFHKSMMEGDGIELLGKKGPRSLFRRQVLNVLRKPYDKQESKRLQKEFMTRAYVKFHSEFLKKLTTFRQEKGKCLAILRGFSFWVKNLAQEGSFKPWEDEECLKVDATLF